MNLAHRSIRDNATPPTIMDINARGLIDVLILHGVPTYPPEVVSLLNAIYQMNVEFIRELTHSQPFINVSLFNTLMDLVQQSIRDYTTPRRVPGPIVPGPIVPAWSQYLDPVVISLDAKLPIIKQLITHFTANSEHKQQQYWQKTGNVTFKNAITLEFKYGSEPGVDMGGIRGKIFAKIRDELKTSIFKCDSDEIDFICLSGDPKTTEFYKYANFIGLLIGQCYANKLILGWAPNPFFVYKLLFTGELDDENLQYLIRYCRCIEKHTGLYMYNPLHSQLFAKICTDAVLGNCEDVNIDGCTDDANVEELMSLYVSMQYTDIIKQIYYVNLSNVYLFDRIIEGYISVRPQEQPDKTPLNNIKKIHAFIKILQGSFDVDTDKIIGQIVVTGNFREKTHEESVDKIKEIIKIYLNDSKPMTPKERIMNARRLYGYFTGNVAINYDATLTININNASDRAIDEHSCAGYINLNENYTYNGAFTTIDFFLDNFVDEIRKYKIEMDTTSA